MAVATKIADRVGTWYVGKYTGTTAAQSIYIGFKPSFIIMYNTTDGDDVNIWCKDSATTFVNIAAAAGTITAAVVGVDDGTGIGFSLPTDSDINENGKVYVFLALPE